MVEIKTEHPGPSWHRQSAVSREIFSLGPHSFCFAEVLAPVLQLCYYFVMTPSPKSPDTLSRNKWWKIRQLKEKTAEKPIFEREEVVTLNQGAVATTKPTHKYQPTSLGELMFAPESGLSEKHCREDRFVHRTITTWVN